MCPPTSTCVEGVHPVAAVTVMSMTMLRCVGVWDTLGKKELEQGRAQGVYKGSKGVWEVDVLMCPPTSTSVEGVQPVAAVTDMGMTML